MDDQVTTEERGRGRGVVLKFALGILVVLVVAELAVRAVAPFLPDPKLYGDSTTQVKVAQLDGLGGCTSVVVAGNSMARDAFDPGLDPIWASGEKRSYNASLDAASPALLDRWLMQEVLPRAQPRVAVVAVASLDLNANSKAGQAARQAYDEAPATAAGTLGRIGTAFTARSATVAHRRELTDPEQWAPAVDHLRAGTRPEHVAAQGIPGLIGPQGQGLADKELRYEPNGSPIVRRFVTQQLLNDFAIDDTSIGGARLLVRDLKAAGVTVVLAALPVTDEYISFHPNGRADFDRYLTVLGDIAATEQVPLLDLHHDAPPAEFADTHHLNELGAARFTSELAGRLGALGVTPQPCPR